MSRLSHIRTFYLILAELGQRTGGARILATCSGRDGWPERGVYFFLEPGELRSTSGEGYRVVRVGTHALKTGGQTRLWTRLSQHRGVFSSRGGNHRGSIFRLLVGAAMLARESDLAVETWGQGSSGSSAIRRDELTLERRVSQHIGAMQVLVLDVSDAPGPESVRGYIERNALGLLSNYSREPEDQPSAGWLGLHCPRDRVQRSGLWNNNHVDETYEPAFLDVLHRLVRAA